MNPFVTGGTGYPGSAVTAEPEADSRARPGLFLATFMLLLDITVVNTALPSIQGQES